MARARAAGTRIARPRKSGEAPDNNRKPSGVVNGHSHSYTEFVSGPTAGTNRTSVNDGHSHRIVRDKTGRAIEIERADNHSHPL